MHHRNMLAFAHDMAAAAVMWLRKASEQGFDAAQAILGMMYAKGQGAPKDDVIAYKWWLLAAAQGSDGAKANIEILERNLTSEQRAEGQRMAREFQPTEAPAAAPQ